MTSPFCSAQLSLSPISHCSLCFIIQIPAVREKQSQIQVFHTICFEIMRSYGKEKKLRFPYVFMACCFFFTIIGFTFFNHFSQVLLFLPCIFNHRFLQKIFFQSSVLFLCYLQGNFSEIPTRRSINEETESLDHGETGDGFVSNIPFQVHFPLKSAKFLQCRFQIHK